MYSWQDKDIHWQDKGCDLFSFPTLFRYEQSFSCTTLSKDLWKAFFQSQSTLHQLKRCDNKITRTITTNTTMSVDLLRNCPGKSYLDHSDATMLETFLELLFRNCVERARFTNHPRKWIALPCGHTLSILSAVSALRMSFKLRCFEPVWSQWDKICHQWNLPVSDFSKQNLSIQVFMNCLLKFNKQFMNCSASSKID